MNNKWWCFFGIHEYKVIASGPYEKVWEGLSTRTGSYYVLNCQCCGKTKRKILC